MAKRPTKVQLEKQELVSETIRVVLAAGAKVLQDNFNMSDGDSGRWIIDTASLLAQHIGTEQALAELAEARKVLEGDD